MYEFNLEFLEALNDYLKTVTSRGVEFAEKKYPDFSCTDDNELVSNLKKYIEMVRDAYLFNKTLSNGDLSVETSSLNFLAMPSKALQANLKHLVWQTKRIKEGDLQQKVSFLGDFSDSFNSLVDALKVKRELEKKVARNENRLRTITSVLGDGVIVTDTDTKITFGNPEACKLLEIGEDGLLGRKFHELVHIQHSDGKWISSSDCFLYNTIDEKVIYRSSENSFTKSSGQIFPVSISCNPIINDGEATGAVIAFHDITEEKKYQQSLEYINKILKIQSTTDHLTSAYNRQYFNEQMGKEIAKAKRYSNKCSFIIFDIDKFKTINDTFGHSSGDSVLKSISKLAQKNIRESDVFARWGGEEFVVLVGQAGIEEAAPLAEKLRSIFAEYNFSIDRKVTCSFGVTEYIVGDEMIDIVNRADEALYQAKETGRNRVVIAQS